MQVAIVTFDRFNEIDSFVALNILNRMSGLGVRADICAPTPSITSMNGVCLQNVRPLEFAASADAVLISSGQGTAQAIADSSVLGRLRLDATRQLIGSQCSGALVLAKLGLLDDQPACTDSMTRPALEAAGVRVIESAFHCVGNIATAGGCLASSYLAAWLLQRKLGDEAVQSALTYVAPVGEEKSFVQRHLTALAL
ncbi:MAG: DJ-1/PfpI family protein [Kofleriaceae bacterium]|nr:DJ-1/PfpI family protein [Kofleriaceae bacterium]